jgi:hypothetical protein
LLKIEMPTRELIAVPGLASTALHTEISIVATHQKLEEKLAHENQIWAANGRRLLFSSSSNVTSVHAATQ